MNSDLLDWDIFPEDVEKSFLERRDDDLRWTSRGSSLFGLVGMTSLI